MIVSSDTDSASRMVNDLIMSNKELAQKLEMLGDEIAKIVIDLKQQELNLSRQQEMNTELLSLLTRDKPKSVRLFQ